MSRFEKGNPNIKKNFKFVINAMKEMPNKTLQHLEFLTAIQPFRNWINRESLLKASDYIDNEFREYGLKTNEQKWKVGNFEYKNIIAKYKPELESRLIIGAHYDVFSNQPGADDNASGVAGLLELARLVAKNQPILPYGIDFVGYCLEEPPHFGTKNMGSYIHAESLHESETIVIGMICLDMIGYFSNSENSQQYPPSNFTANLSKIGNYIAVVGLTQYGEFSQEIFSRMSACNQIPVELINFPTNDGLAGLSDHRNYWHFEYNALMINDTAKFRNPNYHQLSDTVETLNIEMMNKVILAVYHAIETPIKSIVPKQAESKPIELEKISFIERIRRWFKR